MCSYCAIPLITGRHTSRPKAEILAEVRWLVSQGVKELNVIAQDLSSYGLDLEKRHMLPELIDEMAQIEGVEWIRLHYAYPTDFPEKLLDVMAKHATALHGPYVGADAAPYHAGRTGRVDQKDPRQSAGNMYPNDPVSGTPG